MKKVNLGVISYAHPHAPRYAAAITTSPRANLTGIAGLGANAEQGVKEAAQYGVPYYADYRQLVERDDLMGVYIGTEPRRHLEVVQECAARGKHVLCDKPIALKLTVADEIIRIAQEAGIKLMVPFNPRFQLPVMKVKEILESGQAGELVSIFAIKYGKLPTKIPSLSDYSWLVDPEQAGGGGFLDIGIHAVDALRWLAGSEAKRVYAHVSTAFNEGLLLDDHGAMTVEFENDVVGALSAGWANPDGYPTWLDVRFEILTTKAAFLIDSPYHNYSCYDSIRTEKQYWWRRDIEGLVDEFVDAIVQDREPAISGTDARQALAIMLAAYESSVKGEAITLNAVNKKIVIA